MGGRCTQCQQPSVAPLSPLTCRSLSRSSGSVEGLSRHASVSINCTWGWQSDEAEQHAGAGESERTSQQLRVRACMCKGGSSRALLEVAIRMAWRSARDYHRCWPILHSTVQSLYIRLGRQVINDAACECLVHAAQERSACFVVIPGPACSPHVHHTRPHPDNQPHTGRWRMGPPTAAGSCYCGPLLKGPREWACRQHTSSHILVL